jgi:hypothetical protein
MQNLHLMYAAQRAQPWPVWGLLCAYGVLHTTAGTASCNLSHEPVHSWPFNTVSVLESHLLPLGQQVQVNQLLRGVRKSSCRWTLGLQCSGVLH